MMLPFQPIQLTPRSVPVLRRCQYICQLLFVVLATLIAQITFCIIFTDIPCPIDDYASVLSMILGAISVLLIRRKKLKLA